MSTVISSRPSHPVPTTEHLTLALASLQAEHAALQQRHATVLRNLSVIVRWNMAAGVMWRTPTAVLLNLRRAIRAILNDQPLPAGPPNPSSQPL